MINANRLCDDVDNGKMPTLDRKSLAEINGDLPTSIFSNQNVL
jgi:hypothetical protein